VCKATLRSLLLIVSSIFTFVAPISAQNSPHVRGELLIAPRRGISDAQLESIYQAHGGQKIQTLSQIGVHHINVPGQALEAIEAALRKNPNVEFVEKNFIGQAEFLANDPGYPSQWHLPKISASTGWDMATGTPAVPIAIIDSGVDPLHPDLAENLIPGYNFVSGNSDTHDVYGHGTAVAGATAALCNNGIGVCGVSWNNSIMPLVVIDSTGSGTVANVSSAITYAADHGAKVLNLSLAFTSSSSTLQNAVNYAWNKGAIIVAAAANYSTSTPYYPAALNNVVAVSATDQNDNLASFSNYGDWVDVSAPGVSIYTTANGGGYRTGSGTSFSSPIVAGLAALVFSLNPSLTNTQVVSLIQNNADDLGSPGFDQYYGWGRVNVYRTLAAAYTSTPAPSVAITSPSNGATVSGTVPVNVSASSTVGISRVELYIDGALSGTAYAAPYSFAWNTTGISNSHSLIAKAYDVLGVSTTSSTTNVTVSSTSTPPPASVPTMQITNITFDGKFLSIAVSASSTQSVISKVELYVDGALKGTDTASPWAFKLNTQPWPKGTHTLQVKGYDGVGNVGTSSLTSFTK
jgi:thermitase